jgi:Carboxypeptidase regulatory-like domain
MLSTRDETGIVGRVHLGPQCPVERVDRPCADKPPDGATVTVTRQGAHHLAGSAPVAARTTTDAHGDFRVALTPGTYTVTADAGMSCESVTTRVTGGAKSKVEIECDTGIR